MRCNLGVRALVGASGLALSAVAAQAQYGVVVGSGTFTDISASGAVIAVSPGTDDATGPFTSFVTNALVTSASLNVTTNGAITSGPFSTFTNSPLPISGQSVALCPLWDDLQMDSAGATIVHGHAVEGGVNVEIIEWVNARLYSGGTGTGNFEVKIFASGPVYVQYLYQGTNSWNNQGSGATIGVQWGSGSYSQYSLNQAVLGNNTVLSVVQVPTGACCGPLSGCTITDSANCASQGGTFGGAGSTCGQINCPTGACCLATTCQILAPAGCAAQGGTYGGDNSTCASANCPVGACCLPYSACQIMSPNGCTGSSGVYQGNGSTCGTCPAPSNGPDVIVSEVFDVGYNGTVGNITAYSVGTDACNISGGTLAEGGVQWQASTNHHPLISGNMFRLKNVGGANRFEQIGLSWFKNGFSATNSSFCGGCKNGGGSVLGPNGCSDVYSSGLNGGQSNMGPRSVVNGTTGDYPYPYTLGWQTSGDAIFKHCQVLTSDIDPVLNSGALYFAEAHYMAFDDARYSAGGANAVNGLNNYSYRRILISSPTATPTFPSGTPGLTRQLVPAIQAWRDNDASVTQVNAEYIDSTVGSNIVARFIVSAGATSLGGGLYHYEYAVYNVNADRSGGSFSVPVPAGTIVTNVGFHAPFYHSGEIYDNTAWDSTVSAGAVTWTPHAFSPAANANAIRWGTMYTFRFDANVGPSTGSATLGLFKTGTPASLAVGGIPVPGAGCYANCDDSTAAPILNVADFSCFLTRYSAGDPYANCDGSTAPPVLNVGDFTCFLTRYSAGCP